MSGTVKMASSTILPLIVVRTWHSDSRAWVPRAVAWARAMGLPGNSGPLTSQSRAFFKLPGIPWAYSGDAISSPSLAPTSARNAATDAGGDNSV